MKIFDRYLVKRHRDRTARRFKEYNFLFKEVGDRLVGRICEIKRNFVTVLDLGGHDGYLVSVLKDVQGIRKVICCDLSLSLVRQAKGLRVVADEEYIPFKSTSFDLVLSNLSLHWVNDLPGTLLQIRHILKSDGFFLASIFGSSTLCELRHVFMESELLCSGGISPRVSPFVDIRDAGMLLQRAGFVLPVVDTETLTIYFENPYHLFNDLRGMGENNALLTRLRKPSARSLFHDVTRRYQSTFGTSDGRVFASFEILYLAAWGQHGSRRRPLSPGSAQTRLADVLKRT